MNKNLTLLAGMAGLSSCVGNSILDKQSNILPQKGVVTEANLLRTCDHSEQAYYFEIDTDATRKGPEYAAVVHFGCGKENIERAQKQFPKGAVIDLEKSAPIISRLVKLGKHENQNRIVFQKSCMERD